MTDTTISNDRIDIIMNLPSKTMYDDLYNPRDALLIGFMTGIHTCHILPPSEIDLGLCLPVFAGSGGKDLFHRIG